MATNPVVYYDKQAALVPYTNVRGARQLCEVAPVAAADLVERRLQVPLSHWSDSGLATLNGPVNGRASRSFAEAAQVRARQTAGEPGHLAEFRGTEVRHPPKVQGKDLFPLPFIGKRQINDLFQRACREN